MPGISGGEFVVLLVLAFLLIGPERLPALAQQLGRLTRELKKLATGAKEKVREELGPEFDDLAKFDPRQYDPRRIVREALLDDEPVKPVSRPPAARRRPPGTPSASAAVAAAGAAAGAAVLPPVPASASDGGAAPAVANPADVVAQAEAVKQAPAPAPATAPAAAPAAVEPGATAELAAAVSEGAEPYVVPFDDEAT